MVPTTPDGAAKALAAPKAANSSAVTPIKERKLKRLFTSYPLMDIRNWDALFRHNKPGLRQAGRPGRVYSIFHKENFSRVHSTPWQGQTQDIFHGLLSIVNSNAPF
jgi:hypothetical protein